VEKEQKSNLLRILKTAQVAIKKRDTRKLMDLSNQTVHDASIFQDEIYLLVAIIIYSLSKVFHRENYKEYSSFSKFSDICNQDLAGAYKVLKEGNLGAFETQMKDFLKKVNKLDKRLKYHMKDVIRKARIRKASRLHEHGVSLGKTAELLGLSQFEMMSYVGSTGISDVKESKTFSVAERMKLVRRAFE